MSLKAGNLKLEVKNKSNLENLKNLHLKNLRYFSFKFSIKYSSVSLSVQ